MGFGEQGNNAIYFREQGNKSLKLKGTGEQRQFGETENTESQDFDFGEQGKMPIFFQLNPHPHGRASMM